jgi:hypothetical protein
MHRKLVWVECSRKWIAKMWRDQSISHLGLPSKSEKNYPTTALECLSVVYFVTLFNFYLAGRKFVVYTNHSALVWLFSTQRTSMYLRWILRLQAYDFQIKHRPGTQMVVPDALSRNPMSLGTVEPYEEVEPLYSILDTFSSAVSPSGVSLYMQSLSPEAHPRSQLCTVCTNISTRPLSFTQMEEHINGRRHLHFLRKTSLSHHMYERGANTTLTSSTGPSCL